MTTTIGKQRPWCLVRGTMWMPDIDLNDIEWHREPRNPAELSRAEERCIRARIMATIRNAAAESPNSKGGRAKPHRHTSKTTPTRYKRQETAKVKGITRLDACAYRSKRAGPV